MPKLFKHLTHLMIYLINNNYIFICFNGSSFELVLTVENKKTKGQQIINQ